MQAEILLCECGCGTSIPSRDARGRPRRFVHGHAGGPLVGHEVTAETREKIRQTKLGSKNASWKGADAGYGALHMWVHRHFSKTGTCELCKSEKKTEWANISGDYLRMREDFLEMCISCHRRYDLMRRKHHLLRIGQAHAS